ncbi:MAG: hypothetical protein ACK5II_10000 [Paracoccus sp. (in: a-proteobacteria)]
MPFSEDLANRAVAELKRCSGRITHLQAEVVALKKKLVKANLRTFGQKADKPPKLDVGPATGTAIPEEEEQSQSVAQNEEAVDPPHRPKRKPSYRGGRGQKNWGPGVEYREVLHETPDKLCPCGCGGGIIDYDTDYTPEVEPARYYIAVHKYAKYCCRLKDQIVGTKYEPKILPKTGMSTRFVAQAINLRHAWFLPWYRQQDIMRQ